MYMCICIFIYLSTYKNINILVNNNNNNNRFPLLDVSCFFPMFRCLCNTILPVKIQQKNIVVKCK